MGQSIPNLARECENRGFLQGFFEGSIQHNHKDVRFGQSDKALIEKTLRLLEDDKNLLVVNPFSYPLVPSLICISYMYASDERLLTSVSSTEGLPMLLFPREGYIGTLENFYFRDVVSGPGIVDKKNVGSPEEFDESHVLNRVTDESVLTSENSSWDVGLVFIDLRKDIWKKNIAQFEEFVQRHSVNSILFYNDERDYSSEAVKDLVDEDIEIDRRAIAEASTSSLGDNPSKACRQEYILTKGVEVSITNVEAEGLVETFEEMYGLKQDLRESLPDLLAVTEVYNLLRELVVEPTAYDEQVQGNFYYNSTEGLIDKLKEFMGQVDETDRAMIDEYWRMATEIRTELEEDNPKKRVLFDRVREANESDTSTVFVTRNRMHRDAVERSLFLEDVEVGDSVDIVTKSDTTPRPDSEHVFLNLPGYRNPLYEFPPSRKIEFLVYPFTSNVVQSEIEESRVDAEEVNTEASDSPVSITNRDEIGRPQTVEFNPEEIESDISNTLSVDSDGGTGTGGQGYSKEEVRITYSDGTERSVSSNDMMTILDPEKETVLRKYARNLQPGDDVVIMGDAATDLYETITQHEHQKKSIEQRELLIERWREILDEGLEGEYTPSSLLEEMREKGSDISSEQVIRQWRDGSTMGPQSREDVHRVLEILRPGSEGSSEEIHEAMRYIRTLHRRIGRRVKRLVEAEIDPTREAEFDSGIGSQLNDIEDKINIKNVSGCETV